MRRDGALAEDFASRHGVPRWTTDAKSVIEGDDVVAVYIASPVGQHEQYALDVAKAGKPCYVEKPMARSAAECNRMVDAFKKAKQPLFVAYYRRALPRFVEAKRLIDAGEIGKITAVSFALKSSAHRREYDRANLPWRVVAEQSGGGIFFDLASHTLDAIDFMVGPAHNATGSAANIASPFDVEDTVALSFNLENGAPGVGQCCFCTNDRADSIVINGTDGTIELASFSPDTLTLRKGESAETTQHEDPTHVQINLIQSIVDQLLGRGSCPSTGESAARTAAVLDAATSSYYGGRSENFWARPETWPGRRNV
jgi:predicted dehydrogenase